GLPLSIGKSRDALRGLYALAAARARRWYGVLPGDRAARLGGRLVVPFAQRRPPFWVWNAAGRELYMSTFHLAPELVPHYLDALVRYRVVCLTGYTSSLVALAHEVLRAGRVDLRMKVVVTSAEPRGEDQRAATGAAFGRPVRQGQLVQESVRRIRVRFVPAPAFTEAAGRTLAARVRDRLGDVEVVLEPVAELPRTAAGKVRAIVADMAWNGT